MKKMLKMITIGIKVTKAVFRKKYVAILFRPKDLGFEKQ